MADQLPAFALESTSMRIVSSFALCALFMYIGHVVREKLALARRVMLPAALIGGILALIFIQLCNLNEDVATVVAHDWVVGWSQLPGFLINVIFATLFLGARVPGIKEAWKLAGPQLAYGQVLAWGNWVVGCLVTAAILEPAFGVNVLFGSLFPVGFEGGHGTAAGLQESYVQLDFPEGGDLAVTSATVGILCGVLIGTAIVNLGQARLWTYSSYKAAQENDVDIEKVSPDRASAPAESIESESASEMAIDDKDSQEAHVDQDERGAGSTSRVGSISKPSFLDKAVIPVGERVTGSLLSVKSEAIDTMALHLAVVGVAILLAYFTKRALMALEGTNEWLTEYAFLSGFPLFPLCMIWGGILQVAFDSKWTGTSPLDRGTVERISGAALDYLVMTAVATTKLDAVAASLAPLCVLLLLGLTWQLLCFFFIAPLMLPDFWFERALAELGKSMGTTATGLMLLRMVDPRAETPTLKAFSCKQLLHEPFMGGGLWTSIALPLTVALGNWALVGIGMSAILFWVAIWALLFRKAKLGPMVQYKFNPEYNVFPN